MKRLIFTALFYVFLIPLSFGMECGDALKNNPIALLAEELLGLEEKWYLLVNRHKLLNPRDADDAFQDKLGSPVILPGEVPLDPNFIAKQLSMDSFEFNFKGQEEVRYFLHKKFKEGWLEKGKSLLSALGKKEKKRAELSADEKLLADSTLLYLQYEYVYNRNLVQEESIRAAKTIVVHDIAKLELEIDDRRKKIGLPPINKPIKESSRKKPEQFYADAAASTKLYVQAKTNIEEWNRSLESLKRNSDYPTTLLESGFYLFNEREFWETLGYDSRPID